MYMHRLRQREDRSVAAVLWPRDAGVAPGRPGQRRAARMRAGVAMAALLVTGGAGAADLPVRAASPAPVYDWSGFYAGGHIGFAAAGSDFTATQPGGGPLYGTLDLFRPYDLFTGEGSDFGGFQAGYNTVLKSGSWSAPKRTSRFQPTCPAAAPWQRP
jgi:hypothetical protein